MTRPVTDTALAALIDTARAARDGRATEGQALALIDAAPELLAELLRNRRAIASLRGHAARLMRRHGTPAATLVAVTPWPEVAA